MFCCTVDRARVGRSTGRVAADRQGNNLQVSSFLVCEPCSDSTAKSSLRHRTRIPSIRSAVGCTFLSVLKQCVKVKFFFCQIVSASEKTFCTHLFARCKKGWSRNGGCVRVETGVGPHYMNETSNVKRRGHVPGPWVATLPTGGGQ